MDGFLITVRTYGDKLFLQNERYATLLINCILHYRTERQFVVHAFVVMPDHAHIVLSPIAAKTVKHCVQLIKRSFSHLVRKKIGYSGEVWREGFQAKALPDAAAFCSAVDYTHQNPVRQGLCTDASDFRFSSACPEWKLDEAPQWLTPLMAEELSRA